MNDDELIERLRATLRAEADAVTPMHGTPRVSPRRHRSRRDSLLNRTVVVLASAAAIATAVAVTLSLTNSGSHHTSTFTSRPAVTVPTTVGRPAAPSTTLRPSPTTTVTTPTTPATSPTTLAPSTTVVPAGAVGAVPATFTALSVTFISTTVGWVLGTEPCATGSCLHLAYRSSSGRWTDEDGPTGAGTLPAADSGSLQVRFADPEDGWIYDVGTGSYWSTHDGGSSWAAGTLPGAIDALESSGDIVVVAITAADGRVMVESSPAASTAFGPVAQIAAPTSGTTPTATVVMQSSDATDPVGWVLATNDRGVVGGLRYAKGTWTPWTSAPCATAAGPALLAASDPGHLVAVCEPGTAAKATGESVVVSSNGGNTFTAAGGGTPLPVTAVATPAAGTIVGVSTSDPASLVASIGSGAWRVVAPDVQTGAKVVQVGFEDSAQGVAIVSTAAGGTLLETTDGGVTWNAVSL